MKKVLSVLLTLCLFANVSFAFDPYADEEVEKKSYKKLYYGIVLTLVGGFLAYDGFSTEEVDVSKPSVDYTTVLHSEWNGSEIGTQCEYTLRSGQSPYKYKIDGTTYDVEKNILYNNGNVDLEHINIEVRYKYSDGEAISDYRTAKTTNESTREVVKVYDDCTLAKGESLKWSDLWFYTTAGTDTPAGDSRVTAPSMIDNLDGLNLGKNALTLMDVRVVLNKNQQYKPIYETRHKSDLEGVAGIMVGLTGIYFLVDYFIDMHKFNNYAKRHNLNLKFVTASNEYKLMLQKRV